MQSSDLVRPVAARLVNIQISLLVLVDSERFAVLESVYSRTLFRLAFFVLVYAFEIRRLSVLCHEAFVLLPNIRMDPPLALTVAIDITSDPPAAVVIARLCNVFVHRIPQNTLTVLLLDAAGRVRRPVTLVHVSV
jgi:hypothetical protein